MEGKDKNASTEAKETSTGKLTLGKERISSGLSSNTHPSGSIPFKFQWVDVFAKEDEFLDSIPFRMDPNVVFSEDEEEEYTKSDDEVEDEHASIRSEDGFFNRDSDEEHFDIKSEDEDDLIYYDSVTSVKDTDNGSECSSQPKTKEADIEVAYPKTVYQQKHSFAAGWRTKPSFFRPPMASSVSKERIFSQKENENSMSSYDCVPKKSTTALTQMKSVTSQNRGPLERITETNDSSVSNKSKTRSYSENLMIDPLWKLQKGVLNQKQYEIPQEDHMSNLKASGATQKKSESFQKDISTKPVRFSDYPKVPSVPQTLSSYKTKSPGYRSLGVLHASSTPSTKQAHDSGFAQPKSMSYPKTPVPRCRPNKPTGSEASTEKNTSIPNKVITVNGKHYTILSLVGKGGSCKVFSVYDDITETVLAVKLVNLDITDPGVINGYKKEIEYLKMLQESNRVIKMFDYEYFDNELRLVLEKGDTDLARVIANEMKIKPLTPHTIKFYWSHMLEAVAEIHKFGIVHSDLKPANFLLVAGQLKLIDFGIAASVPMDMTSAFRDTAMGTLNYMSPEAINFGDSSTKPNGQKVYKVSTKSDVWSLGCILYNLVYGRSPFHNYTTMIQRIQAILNPNCQIPFPPNDPLLIDVIQSCLKRDPKQRVSVDELLKHPYLAPEDNKNGSSGKVVSQKSITDSLLAQLEALTPRRRTVVSQVIKDLQIAPAAKK